MKVKVIKSQDRGIFERELNKICSEYKVVDIQTHTESNVSNISLVITYIAIVFYKDSTPVVFVKNLDFTSRTYNALYRAGIETVDQLKEAMYNGRIKRVRNLGKVSIEEIEKKLEEM